MGIDMTDYQSIYGTLDCELPAKKLFRHSIKKRYLGDVDARQHHLNLGHALNIPVYQVTGCPSPKTITYRPKTTDEIIQEEQQKFHSYCAQTSDSPKSPRRSQTAKQRPKRNKQTLIFVKGEGPTSRPHTSGPRVQTIGPQIYSPGPRLQSRSSWNPKKSAAGRLHSQSDKQIRFDQDYIENRIAYEETKSRIVEHRRPQSHTLNIGAFKRGNDGSETNNQQWLTFGGGVRNSGGLIEAFTNMKSPEEYYSINGATGAVIANKLRKQDKISIGINGKAVEHKYVKSKYEERMAELGLDVFNDSDSDIVIRPSSLKLVPLCWNDQFDEEDPFPTKTIEPSSPREPTRKVNLNETHPVVFNKLVDSSSVKPKAAVRANPPPGGFTVRHRSKYHKTLIGNDTSMTEISIAAGDNQSEPGNIDYDQILEYAVGTAERSSDWETQYKNFKDMKHMNNQSVNGQKIMSAKSSKTTSDKHSIEPKFIVRPSPNSPPLQGVRNDLYITAPKSSKSIQTPPTTSSSAKSLPKQQLQGQGQGKLIRGRSNMGATPPSIRDDYNQGERSFIKINHSYSKPGKHENEKIHTSGITVLSVSGDNVDYVSSDDVIEGHGIFEPSARANSPASDHNDESPELPDEMSAPPNTYREEVEIPVEQTPAEPEETTEIESPEQVPVSADERTECADDTTDIDEENTNFAISVSIKPKADSDE